MSAFNTPYACPMHAEECACDPCECPKCGRPMVAKWTCPMHPQIVTSEPGDCPICGMALEPVSVMAEEEENPELIDMRRRFWVSAALTIPLFGIAMGDLIPGQPIDRFAGGDSLRWLELLLATPVVAWGMTTRKLTQVGRAIRPMSTALSRS